MDFASGKKYARNIPLADRNRYRKFSTNTNNPTSNENSNSLSSSTITPTSSSIVPTTSTPSDASVPSGLAAAVMEAHQEEIEGTDVDNTDDTLEPVIDPRITALDLDPASSRMATILLGLPEPELEVEAAFTQGMSREQIQDLLKKVWNRRQEVLKEAFAHAKTEGNQMQELLNQLLQPEKHNLTTEDTIDILESLEFFVATMHNAEDFHAIGGFNVIIQLLNHTNILIRTPAAWILGTAIKGHNGLQRAALDLGLAPALMEMLHKSLDTLTDSLTTPTKTEGLNKNNLLALKAANKVIYALNGLIRYSSLAQSHVLAVGGGETLMRTLTIAQQYAVSTVGTKQETGLTPVERQARTLISKIFTLLSDLAQDEQDHNTRLQNHKEELSTESNLVRVKLSSSNNQWNETANTNDPTTNNHHHNHNDHHHGPMLTRVEKDISTGRRKVFNVITSDNEETTDEMTDNNLSASVPLVEPLPFLDYIRKPPQTNQNFCTTMRSAVQAIQSYNAEEGSADYEINSMVNDSSKNLAHQICPK